MIAFLVGIVTALVVTGVWTKKYLPGEPEEDFVKYMGFTFCVGMVLNIIILALLK